jgi:hypothetical protein
MEMYRSVIRQDYDIQFSILLIMFPRTKSAVIFHAPRPEISTFIRTPSASNETNPDRIRTQ